MKYTWLILLLFLSNLADAQIISSIISSQDTLELGEECELIYKLSIPKDIKINNIDFSIFEKVESLVNTSQDSLVRPYYAEIEFEAIFKNYENSLVPSRVFKQLDQGGQYILRDTFKARFWDIGVFQIPHPELILDSASVQKEPLLLEPPTIFVLPPMHIQNQDTTEAILPIKDILVTEKSWRDYINHMLLFLGLCLLLGLAFFLLRKKPIEETIITIEKPKEPAHVIANKRLSKLKEEEIWKLGEIKKYQSELTFTLREYLENRYSIKALENTTDEIIKQIKKHGISSDNQTTVKEILQIADMVKFAKAKPSENIHENFLIKTSDFVSETKEIIIDSENLDVDG